MYSCNAVTWKSGFVKSTDQIVIIISYRNFIWPHFCFFNRTIIATTKFILSFIIYITFIYLFNIDIRNGSFYSWYYLIKFFTVWNFSLCQLFSLIIIYTCYFPCSWCFCWYHQVPYLHYHRSFPGMWYLGIIILPHPSYLDYFLFHFHSYPCISCLYMT